MLPLLLATAIGVLKVAHDSGRSKLYFILAMIISPVMFPIPWWLGVAFLLPLLVYVQETGDLHKLNKTNTPKLSWKHLGYAYLVTNAFILPFLLTKWYMGLPLLLWPIMLRNLTYRTPSNAEWWWICTFSLFFSYSALYFYSL